MKMEKTLPGILILCLLSLRIKKSVYAERKTKMRVDPSVSTCFSIRSDSLKIKLWRFRVFCLCVVFK